MSNKDGLHENTPITLGLCPGTVRSLRRISSDKCKGQKTMYVMIPFVYILKGHTYMKVLIFPQSIHTYQNQLLLATFWEDDEVCGMGM